MVRLKPSNDRKSQEIQNSKLLLPLSVSRHQLSLCAVLCNIESWRKFRTRWGKDESPPSCRLCPNLNAFFVYHTSNCLLVLSPLTHGVVHRNFIFHERQNHAMSKKKIEILRGFDGKTLLRMLISQARCNVNKKYQKSENHDIEPDQTFFFF